MCAGKKFAQVELVAVMAISFKDWTVSPTLEEGETTEQAKRRVMGAANDSKMNITLQMKQSPSVKFVWEKRPRLCCP